MDAPLSIPVPHEPSPSADGKVLAFVLAPGFFVAALFYLGGSTELALGVAGTATVIATLIAPEVGVYLYFAGQAFDQMVLTDREGILTPGKIFAPFILLAYALHPHRARIPMLVSQKFIGAMVLLGVFGLLSAVWAISWLAALRYGGQIIVQALLVVVAVHRLADRRQLSRALYFMIFGGVAASLYLILWGNVQRGFSRATLSEFINPNSTALAASVALMCIPPAWCYTRQKWLRLVLLASVPIMLAGLLQTGSRSQLVAVLAAPVLAVFVVRRAGAMARLMIPVACGVLVAGSIYYAFSAGLIGESSTKRLQELMSRGIDTGGEARSYIWGLSWGAFLQQPWGFGFGNSSSVLQAKYGFFKDVHSSVLGVLVDGGVISFALFVYAMWYLFQQTRNIRNGGLAMAAMMLYACNALSLLTHTIHFSKYFWLPVMVGVAIVETARREELAEPQAPPQPAPSPGTSDVLQHLGPADAVVY